MPFRVKKPLLHLACERGAWKCVQQLVITRSDEINLIKDEYYPIHQAILHDLRFVELLILHGAETTVRTCTQQMSLLHVGQYMKWRLITEFHLTFSSSSSPSRSKVR